MKDASVPSASHVLNIPAHRQAQDESTGGFLPRPHSKGLRLSGWFSLRGEEGPSAALVAKGVLGGSQAGVRVNLPVLKVSNDTTLELGLRLSSPLGMAAGKEAAPAISIRRLGSLPLEVALERRMALNRGGRNAFAVVASAGKYALPVAEKLHLNADLQFGIVGFRARDKFADGAVSIERDLGAYALGKLSAGVGAWGAVQPGLSRLDVGPMLVARIPTGAGATKIGAAWRFRIAGHADPGSGPALLIGTDF